MTAPAEPALASQALAESAAAPAAEPVAPAVEATKVEEPAPVAA